MTRHNVETKALGNSRQHQDRFEQGEVVADA
jgi:hypothetical protein